MTQQISLAIKGQTSTLQHHKQRHKKPEEGEHLTVVVIIISQLLVDVKQYLYSKLTLYCFIMHTFFVYFLFVSNFNLVIFAPISMALS